MGGSPMASRIHPQASASKPGLRCMLPYNQIARGFCHLTAPHLVPLLSTPFRWGRPVIVYGPSGLSKDNPVISYLSKEGRCSSLGYYKEGLEAFEAKFPYLVTASVKQGCLKQ